VLMRPRTSRSGRRGHHDGHFGGPQSNEEVIVRFDCTVEPIDQFVVCRALNEAIGMVKGYSGTESRQRYLSALERTVIDNALR
jgi:hypothetical protein